MPAHVAAHAYGRFMIASALQLTKASKLHQSSHHKPDLIIHREQNRKTSETVAKIIKATETPTMSGCWPVKAISWKGRSITQIDRAERR
ncbi:hypothetical protein N7504_003758 [Penicillium tannophilum]|nr:hypothetical protein N7504_003758 [Penicillium tannophilum]